MREGFCFAAVEAMSTGIPVLRTRTGGTMSQIIEDVTGRSTPVERNEFVEAAAPFLADRDALRRMGHAAAAHVRGTLTFDLQLDAPSPCTGESPSPGRNARSQPITPGQQVLRRPGFPARSIGPAEYLWPGVSRFCVTRRLPPLFHQLRFQLDLGCRQRH